MGEAMRATNPQAMVEAMLAAMSEPIKTSG
jgi:hypothetical protein